MQSKYHKRNENDIEIQNEMIFFSQMNGMVASSWSGMIIESFGTRALGEISIVMQAAGVIFCLMIFACRKTTTQKSFTISGIIGNLVGEQVSGKATEA